MVFSAREAFESIKSINIERTSARQEGLLAELPPERTLAECVEHPVSVDHISVLEYILSQ